MNRNLKISLLATVSAVSIAAAYLIEPVAQDPAYHQFADQRTVFGVPNFWNVVTNLPMVVVGLMGLWRVTQGRSDGVMPSVRFAYNAFFLGLFLTGWGSSYYHIAPDNASLMFDRLPMTILFIAFFCIVWGEHISPRVSRWIMGPLIAIGLAAVLYWYWTETLGRGDLRPYALVQFLPLILTPLILILYRSASARIGLLWAVLAAYGASKAAELLDRPIYELAGVISGHSVKHLAAALATYLLYLRMGRSRSGSR